MTTEAPQIARSQGSERGSIGETLLMAVCASLISAAAYGLRFALRFAWAGEIVNVSRDLAWMAPLSSLFFFMLAAIPAGIVACVLPRPVARRVGFGGFAGLALFAILLSYSQIATLASLVLSLGAGVAISRWADGDPRRALRVTRTIAVVLVVAFVATAIAIEGNIRMATRRTLAALPPATAGAPSVLLVVLDAVRASALSTYGAPRPTTPHLDAFAREGVLFERAFSVAPWTLPSHESMLTGEYQFVGGRSSSFLRRPVDDDKTILPNLFRARGLETAGFVANFHYTGWDSELDRGFARYADHPRSIEQTLLSSSFGQTMTARRMYATPTLRGIARALSRPDLYTNPKPVNANKQAAVITDQFLSWIDRREARPFFAFLNYNDAHEPYEPPPPYDTMYDSLPKSRHLYDGAVTYMDAQVGRLLEGLKHKGLLDNTLVLITADHGELFGEHGLTGHHSNLYFDVLHVPLILHFPGRVPPGIRISRPVSLRDLAATILDLAAVADSGRVPGRTLAAHWRDSTVITSPIFAAVERGVRVDSTLPFAKGDMVTMIDDQWHYIRNNGTGREELYRYLVDSDESHDLVKDAAADSVAERLRRTIRALIEHGPAAPVR
ncbi:MAG: sulfatase [Gemmatimonadaceae bacterium]